MNFNKIILPNDEEKKKDIYEQYRIVWIPIVENQWTEEVKQKFKQLAKNKPWQAFRYFSTIAGTKYFRDEWKFKNKPMAAVTSPQGSIEYINNVISDQINIWESILHVSSFHFWFRPLADCISKDMSTLVIIFKLIFFTKYFYYI